MNGGARDGFRQLFGRVAVVEVTGGVDFGGLVGVVDKLLSASPFVPAWNPSPKIYPSVIVP